MRRVLAAAFLLLCLCSGASARGIVFGQPEMRDGPGVLSLRVAPLLGADCMLMGMDGEWMLVDMGTKAYAPVIMEMLDSLGITRIDHALNTHPHDDHIGALPLLLEKYQFGRFLTAFPEGLIGPGVQQVQAMRALKKAGVPVEQFSDGDVLALGDARIEVMRLDVDDVNAASAALKVVYGDTSFLLASDIKRLSQLKLNERYDVGADVLKYPHHGQEPLADGFLEEVNPGFCAITNGYVYSAKAWERLEKEGIRYAFTSWGMVTVFTDGKTIEVDQELTPEAVEYRRKWMEQGRAGLV